MLSRNRRQNNITEGEAILVASQPAHMPKWLAVGIWIFAAAVPLLAISQQSFWIDEAITGNAAIQPTLSSCWQSLAHINGSDLQMPFYMLYVWAWEKIFGGEEMSLRLANYPWFLLGQLAGAFIWSDRRKGLLFVLIAGCNSFVWFYLDEARPYIMEYGAACVVVWFLCSLARADSIPAWKYWLFGFGLIVLAGANMLGVLWTGTSLLIVAFLMAKKPLRPPVLPILFGTAGLLALGGYYFWTLSRGARATHGVPTISNVLYVAYELCGFSGLGPGRLDIREHGLWSFKSYLVPIGVFALILIIVLLRTVKNLTNTEDRRALTFTAAFAVLPLCFLFVAGRLVHFSVLGRHAMPAAPFVFMLLTLGVWALFRDRTTLSKGSIALFFILSLASCFGVRFFSWHARDDYRGAAAAVAAMLPGGKVAWWCASREGAEYYHVEIDGIPDRADRLILWVRNPTSEEVWRLPVPALVILSKADLYDKKGAIITMLKEKGFARRQTLQAFSIWEKRQ